MGKLILAQAQNNTHVSCPTIISGSLIAAGAIMLGKAANDRHNELNREMPFLEAVNEELKKFAKDTQMKMMREQMLKEIKENVNKHSKSLFGFMTGFGLLSAGASIAILNKDKALETTNPSNKNQKNLKQTAKLGATGYALGFALGIAGTGIYNMMSGNKIDSDIILGAIKNGHVSGMGSAAMGMVMSAQTDKNNLNKATVDIDTYNELHSDKLLKQRRAKTDREFVQR